MATVSDHFQLGKSQSELDFVNVELNRDICLFVDPFAISIRPDPWCRTCHATIITYFQRIVDKLRAKDLDGAFESLVHLREPNETRFGYSIGRPQGAGIGDGQATKLFSALSKSAALKTGFIQSLEEAELMIEGIGRDKISDLTTNVIRKHLADYTKRQCDLHGITTSSVALAPYYDAGSDKWIQDYLPLPVVANRPLLMVPKLIARYDFSYDQQHYYNYFVVDYLRAEALSAGSSLVRTLKSGRKKVFKKDIRAHFPCSKTYLYEFSRNHPEVLRKYRAQLTELEKRNRFFDPDANDERVIANALGVALTSIPRGDKHATEYHRLMIGITEFLFFPHLVSPYKEREIHDGRKRIDIVVENAATEGTFYLLHTAKQLPCAYIMIECKNYTSDIANPELDQLAGRFSPNRGKAGIAFCRNFADRALFIRRCRDTLHDDRGLIIPLDDASVLEMLELVANRRRPGIDDLVANRVAEIWLA
jgi:hypothetical protein